MVPKKPYYDKLEKMVANLHAELDDRRQIERELAHMASFSEMAPNPIIETDVAGKIHYINPAALEQFRELPSMGASHAVFEGLMPILQTLQREGKAFLTRPIKLGERIYEQQISLLDGGPSVRLYFSDITELKRLDQLKTDFVNMVSHELRSPLTTINATIKMIAGGVLGGVTDDQKEALRLALNNIERLGRLINELLDSSKIEAGKLELRGESVDMGSLIEEIAQNFKPLAIERGLELRTVIPTENCEIFIDRDKITQVFTNLIQNALKFTEKGYVEISACVDGEGVRCRVSDTGPGIHPNNLPKVFGKFQQFGPSPKGREKGTGLGLALCKGFVEFHGGRIWVESELGMGSQFIFVLPPLVAEDLFKEQVCRLYEEAVSRGQSLTLVSFALEQWTLSRASGGKERQDVVLNRLQAVVKSASGVESVTMAQRRGAVWLVLPEIAKNAALDLVTRVQHDFKAALQVKVASYPEDASRPEQLMQRLVA